MRGARWTWTSTTARPTTRWRDLALNDYGTLFSALFGGGAGVPGKSIASTVSFEANWLNVLKTQEVRNVAGKFEGTFKQTEAHVDWSMKNADGFRFESNPSKQTTVSALLGREKNGVFFV